MAWSHFNPPERADTPLIGLWQLLVSRWPTKQKHPKAPKPDTQKGLMPQAMAGAGATQQILAAKTENLPACLYHWSCQATSSA